MTGDCRQVHYRANSACPAFEALTGLLRDADATMPAPQTHVTDTRVLHSPVATYRVTLREKLRIPEASSQLCAANTISAN